MRKFRPRVLTDEEEASFGPIAGKPPRQRALHLLLVIRRSRQRVLDFDASPLVLENYPEHLRAQRLAANQRSGQTLRAHYAELLARATEAKIWEAMGYASLEDLLEARGIR